MMVEKKKTSSGKGAKKAAPKKGVAKKGASSSKRSSKKAAVETDAPESEVEQATPIKKSKKQQGKPYVAQATLRNLRISPRKARLVVNLIKGKQIEPALQILAFSSKKASGFTEKLLRSAIQNAVEHASADADKLWITDAWVNMGRTLKRYMPRAQGRATPIRKRSAHITIRLAERG